MNCITQLNFRAQCWSSLIEAIVLAKTTELTDRAIAALATMENLEPISMIPRPLTHDRVADGSWLSATLPKPPPLAGSTDANHAGLVGMQSRSSSVKSAAPEKTKRIVELSGSSTNSGRVIDVLPTKFSRISLQNHIVLVKRS